MASPTPWTWVWANSGRQWRTGKSSMLQFMGSQKVKHDLVSEQWTTTHNYPQWVFYQPPTIFPECSPRTKYQAACKSYGWVVWLMWIYGMFSITHRMQMMLRAHTRTQSNRKKMARRGQWITLRRWCADFILANIGWVLWPEGLCPLKFICWILTSKMMIFGDGNYGG